MQTDVVCCLFFVVFSSRDRFLPFFVRCLSYPRAAQVSREYTGQDQTSAPPKLNASSVFCPVLTIGLPRPVLGFYSVDILRLRKYYHYSS
ncbi:hypothetical protein VTN02DRAFT_3226 [Thermoascus thermophilus]